MTLKFPDATREIVEAYDDKSEHATSERIALAAALRMLIKQHQEYADDGCGPFVVYCYDIWRTIEELEADPLPEVTEEENERHFKEAMHWIRNITHDELVELMGEEFLKEFCRVAQ